MSQHEELVKLQNSSKEVKEDRIQRNVEKIEELEKLISLEQDPRFMRWITIVKEKYLKTHALMMTTMDTNEKFKYTGEAGAFMEVVKWHSVVLQEMRDLKQQNHQLLIEINDPEDDSDNDFEDDEE